MKVSYKTVFLLLYSTSSILFTSCHEKPKPLESTSDTQTASSAETAVLKQLNAAGMETAYKAGLDYLYSSYFDEPVTDKSGNTKTIGECDIRLVHVGDDAVDSAYTRLTFRVFGNETDTAWLAPLVKTAATGNMIDCFTLDKQTGSFLFASVDGNGPILMNDFLDIYNTVRKSYAFKTYVKNKEAVLSKKFPDVKEH